MELLKIRWVLFWYLAPVAAAGLALGLGLPVPWLQNTNTALAFSQIPPALYLVWATVRRGPRWLGPLPRETWTGWFPASGILALGYFLLTAGAEPAWARFWAPWLGRAGIPVLAAPVSPVVGPLEGALVLVITALVVPAVEESLFRGALLGRWARWWGPVAAASATALVFGAVHAQGQVFKVVLGLGLAVLTLRSGSLLVPFTTHAAINFFAVGTWLALGGGGGADAGPPSREPEAEAVLALAGGALLAWFAVKMVRGDHPARPRRSRMTRLRYRVSGPPVSAGGSAAGPWRPVRRPGAGPRGRTGGASPRPGRRR